MSRLNRGGRTALLGAALSMLSLVVSSRAAATPFSDIEVSVAQNQRPSSRTVAASGDLVLVGTPDNENALLFAKSGAAFAPSNTFTPTQSGNKSQFGSAVVLSGDRAVIGASGEVNASGVRSGAVYVYQRVSGTWTLSAKLFSSLAVEGNNFGASLAMSENRLVVGAPGSGQIYVFDLVAGSWQQKALQSSFPGLGSTVAIDGNRLVAHGLSGTKHAVYVFDCAQAGCPPTTVLQPAPPDDLVRSFGASVAVRGTRIVVGAPDAPNTFGFPSVGRVFVYELQSSGWTQVATLSEGTKFGELGFGESVALSEERVVVGAPFYTDFLEGGSGEVFVYGIAGTSFPLRETLWDSDQQYCYDYGSTLSLTNSRVVAGYCIKNETFPGADSGTSTVHVIDLVAPTPMPAPASGPFAVWALASALAALGGGMARRRAQN